MTNKLLIFDVDGTLVPTEIPLNIAFTEAIRKLAPKPFHAFDVSYIITNCFGKTVPQIFDQMQIDADHPLDTSLRSDIISVYQRGLPEHLKSYLKPDPVLIGFLERISAHFKTSVASNGLSKTVGISLETAGLSGTFNHSKNNIFTAENVKNPKPAPDLILYAGQKMGVDMGNTVHIEDSPTGARAGLAAGATVIGTTEHAINKTESAKKLRDVGVVQIFDNWHDIEHYLMK